MPEGTIERPLSPSRPRDCGHECRVCKVKVVSLTDYASHISSPTHKQNAEAADKKQGRSDRDEDYFDQALVELIEKRKEQIRKEKEAAAAKLAKDEEERRKKEEFQQRLQEVKERYRLERVWQPPSAGFSGPGHHTPWYRGNRYSDGRGEPNPWHHNKQGKSATWHAQEPPNLQRWASGDFYNEKLRRPCEEGGRTWDRGSYSGSQPNRLPWLSNGGSSNGLYGQNNISSHAPRARPQSFVGFPTPPSFFAQPASQLPGAAHNRGGQPGAGPQREEAPSESDHNGSKNSKAYGSNPKLDKGCRWSPYPVTSGPHGDAHAATSEKYHKASKAQKPEFGALNKQSQPEQKVAQSAPARQSEGESKGYPTKPKSKAANKSTSSSKGSGPQRDEPQASTYGPSGQKAGKPQSQLDRKSPAAPGAELSKASGQPAPHSKPGGLPQPRRDRHAPESLRAAGQVLSEKRRSLDSSLNSRGEMTQPSVEEQQAGRVGANDDRSGRQPSAKPSTDGAAPEKPPAPPSDAGGFLQSLQVSTSVTESSEPAPPVGDGAESKARAAAAAAVAPDEAAEAGLSSEGGDAQALPGTHLAPTRSKLDLPPVLTRDLTKHISPKAKAGGHEPNLNIARRVRNLSESRRSDTEKDSGLKPTVRQLISSSGSRRNVNWEQVYQEVRKKKDKGKGMPRFGIEMVPCEQECHSQEEEDLALLEGFQWESLMDVSVQGSSRKRSLSESSLAPALFSSFAEEEEAPQSKGLSSEQRRPAGNQDDSLGQPEAGVQRQPETLRCSTVRALQRSDSVLGDSSSGTEQQDGQGTGKRRRAAGDVPNTEPSCLGHDSKRRKVKSKKERLQIDQLLAVSLREEELSQTLQSVDTSLIQARATLEAAYVEVQRNAEETPAIQLKEEKVDLSETEPRSPPCAAPSANPPAECVSPPSPGLVVIKEEPRSPVLVSSEMEGVDQITHCAHSTTPELLAPPAPASPGPALNFRSSPEGKFESCHAHGEKPAGCKDKLSGLVQTTEKTTLGSSNHRGLLPDSKSPVKLLSPSRRGSEDRADVQSTQPAAVFSVPASPSETRNGKRVRKLKKRKAFKKAQGTEQPESSDTELDEEAFRPRWLRQRRRASGGSQVSTSSLPADEREAGANPEDGEKTRPTAAPEKREQRSAKQASEPPRGAPAELKENLDSEESMEVTMTSQQHHMDAPPPPLPPPPPPPLSALLPDSSRPEPKKLACNEVSSTSDIDLCKSSESDLPFVPVLPKTSSDVSSDHGEDETPTEGAFDGHQEAVNAIQIHNGLLYTCSGDRTIKAFDLASHQCMAVFEGHSSKVTCLLVSAAPSLHRRLYSGSSDQTIRCYSLKTRELEQQFSLSDRVLCLHSRWRMLYAGLANGTVVTFNLKTNKQMDVFECHGPRAVSCLASSQEGAQRILLVGSYDSTITVRAAKNGLLLRTLQGHTKSVLCMKVVNNLVYSGASDHSVYAHNIHTGELVQVFRGHSHAVTVVAVMGNTMVTACLDKLVRVYDLQTQDQLQVYGGYNDMVLCMALHKNMIYTGCYDGSVQAIKLNVTNGYRCRWHGCAMLFGTSEHLQQHLVSVHAGAKFLTLKCRWRNCQEYFSARGSPNTLSLHMQKHAEEDAKSEP
ncbi:unnamed protein product [Menidia menidia]|uniref:(Atlantic silverside) hypothetical protein n=1 Tax=Menidia menidia TaxID=238744 RepID=A0A8S4ADN0_9TELE|nr:unnamed protein product [Menidia menidia]